MRWEVDPLMRLLYAVRMPSGQARLVEAISFKDCRRYVGSRARIKRIILSLDEHHSSQWDEERKEEIVSRYFPLTWPPV